MNITINYDDTNLLDSSATKKDSTYVHCKELEIIEEF